MNNLPMMSPVVFFVFIAIIIGGITIWDNLKGKIWELQEENKDLKSRIDYLEKVAGDSLSASKFRERVNSLSREKFREKASVINKNIDEAYKKNHPMVKKDKTN